MDLVKKLFEGKRRLVLIFSIFVLALILIIASSAEKENAEDNAEKSLAAYKAELEQELSEICSSVSGVGKCRVSVSFSRGEESSYKGSQLVVTSPPKVLGVAVVCRGGDNDRVKAELTALLSALFDIPANRVAILKLS